jgi:hypothetical protein
MWSLTDLELSVDVIGTHTRLRASLRLRRNRTTVDTRQLIMQGQTPPPRHNLFNHGHASGGNLQAIVAVGNDVGTGTVMPVAAG